MTSQKKAILVGILGALVFIFPSYPFDGSSTYLSALAAGAVISSVASYLTVLEE